MIIKSLLVKIGENGGLRILNISKNELDDRIADDLKTCLEKCPI